MPNTQNLLFLFENPQHMNMSKRNFLTLVLQKELLEAVMPKRRAFHDHEQTRLWGREGTDLARIAVPVPLLVSAEWEHTFVDLLCHPVFSDFILYYWDIDNRIFL